MMVPMRTLALLAIAGVAAAMPQVAAGLPGKPAYTPLPVGSVVPEGWLLEQLKLQADGLSGHLAMFWNDVQHSIWLNGPEDKGDVGLHERGPYWLNGFVPLAFQLKAAGIDVLYPKCGVKKPDHTHGDEPEADERFPVGVGEARAAIVPRPRCVLHRESRWVPFARPPVA